METYKVVDNCAVFRRSPDSTMPYGLDLTDWLAGRTLLSATVAAVAGVTVQGDVIIDGPRVGCAFLGFDSADGADNSCTFHIVTDDGDDFRTIRFVKR